MSTSTKTSSEAADGRTGGGKSKIIQHVLSKAREAGIHIESEGNASALLAFALGYEAGGGGGGCDLKSEKPKFRKEPISHNEDGTLIPSHVEKAVHEHREMSEYVVKDLYSDSQPLIHTYHPEIQGCVFTGHTNTDMDSIGTAIGCAHLYGGVAARSSDVNPETKFCLKRWGMPIPPPFEDTSVQSVAKKRGVVMVDHNQTNQSPRSLDSNSVKGVIDHHALQAAMVQTSAAVFTDIRPWGSCCSIVAHHYVVQNRSIPKNVAGILLSGILSDTLNLQSPTTTDHDRKMVAVLARVVGLHDRESINDLANKQFSAKSEALLSMTTFEIYHGDSKMFTFENKSFKGIVYWATCEFKGSLYMRKLLARKSDFQYEMRAFKKEKGIQFAFLSLVDIASKRSVVIVADEASRLLANQAFTGKQTWHYNEDAFTYDCKPIDSINGYGGGTMELPTGYVSRKKTFVPPVKGIIQDKSWSPPANAMKPDTHNYARVVHNCSLSGCRPMRLRLKNVARGILNARVFLKGAGGMRVCRPVRGE